MRCSRCPDDRTIILDSSSFLFSIPILFSSFLFHSLSLSLYIYIFFVKIVHIYSQGKRTQPEGAKVVPFNVTRDSNVCVRLRACVCACACVGARCKIGKVRRNGQSIVNRRKNRGSLKKNRIVSLSPLIGYYCTFHVFFVFSLCSLYHCVFYFSLSVFLC